MNVLLLGNGFDIYHKLPTKYHNFLHVTELLIKNKQERFLSVGDVLSHPYLSNKDKFVAECYHAHKEVYDNLNIDKEIQTELIKLCDENIWFTYFLQSFDKDAGWIDFEKEIAHVLRAFQHLLKETKPIFSLNDIFEEDPDLKYIILYFNYFYIETKEVIHDFDTFYKVHDRFTTEVPMNSKNYIIDKDKIVQLLFDKLIDAAKALNLYLGAFVENAVTKMVASNDFDKCNAIVDIDHTVTFNYTNTYNVIYSNNTTNYIHGKISDKIVLGINPDKYDNVDTIDTLMVNFKKYFQRTFLGTDVEFLTWLNDIREKKEKIVLLIMGHSLDVTDEDILKELFNEAYRIYILYHDADAKVQQITNLIKMFGKEKFDNIKQDKKLTFLSLNSNFKELRKVLYDNAVAREAEKLRAFVDAWKNPL